jgi:hypothetical protein
MEKRSVTQIPWSRVTTKVPEELLDVTTDAPPIDMMPQDTELPEHLRRL